MVFKLFTTARCAFCKKVIEYKNIRSGHKYFCSEKHKDEYIRGEETRQKALASEGPGGGKGCCG